MWTPLVAIGMLALAGAAAVPARAADTVTDRVFGADLLAPVTAPASFRYRYELKGTLVPEASSSEVRMEVRSVAADGVKQVHFDLFEGTGRRALGPVQAREQNPLVLVFLQRDVSRMGRMTGGTPEYFRQRIRAAFNGPAEVEPVTVDLEGAPEPATRVVIHPFRGDPEIARFRQFEDKSYEFVVAPAIPGGLWRIATHTPGAAADAPPALEESMTFVATTPAAEG